MKSIIFGTEQIGIDFYFEIKKREDVIAFIDNNIEKQGKEILGIKIFPVNMLLQMEFDKIYIASIYHYKNMKAQISELGVPDDKIFFTPIQKNKNKKVKQLPNSCHKATDALYKYAEVWQEKVFEAKWEQLKEEYDEIFVYQFCANAIGETISRYFMIINDICKNNRVLRLFIPDTEDIRRICNKYLMQILGRKLNIVQEQEAAFWAYVIKMHSADLNFSEYERYGFRNDYPAYKLNMNNCNHWFTAHEAEKGNNALEEMGIHGSFVCMAARTAAYNSKTIGHDYSYEVHNMNFEDYEMTIQYLQQQNTMTVKIGRMEEPMKKIENCVDYAGLYANDFMDLFLLSKCEFMITSSSGIVMLSSLFNKPALVVNLVTIAYGYGGMSYNDQSLYISKKYYSVDKRRCLTLREIIKLESRCLDSKEFYEKEGIEFIDNTPEEITAATKEMIDRLTGKWQVDEEEQKNYIKYMEIYHEMEIAAANNPNNWIGGPVPYRMAATYLKENTYLLM
ncbi:MAG: TIGR04372 family glycosyltransferase, partial [Lachnospiraceae bacterium]|nr:TIGR04372 family glycosyltransferase [Lachnospiraceae bacterium]